MSIYTPTDDLTPDQRQLLAEIARKQLAKHLAEAQNALALLGELEPGRHACTCPCGNSGHLL